MRVRSYHRQPRRVVARTLILSSSALLTAGLLTFAPGVLGAWNQGSAEATLWSLLNGARANNGMAPLQQHGTLVSLARWRSSDMIQRDYFSHTIAGSGCEVYCYYDSNGLSYVWGGENIGWNSGRSDSESPIRVHEQFMGSSGHRANVLNALFTHGGVGAFGADNVSFQGHVQNPRMYTELFLQAPAAPPQPAPAPAPRPPSGGGGSAPAPAAPAAPAATPEPTAKEIAVAVPTQPVSSAGIDGVSIRVTGLPEAEVAARLAADDALGVSDERRPAKAAAAAEVSAPVMRVEAAAHTEAGFFESVLGAVLGLFLG
ncbi:MAG: CAP domain-containing protein [Candidatus Limnocylindria bacterium]